MPDAVPITNASCIIKLLHSAGCCSTCVETHCLAHVDCLAGLRHNPEMVYALLHRQDVFEPFKLHARFADILDNIQVSLLCSHVSQQQLHRFFAFCCLPESHLMSVKNPLSHALMPSGRHTFCQAHNMLSGNVSAAADNCWQAVHVSSATDPCGCKLTCNRLCTSCSCHLHHWLQIVIDSFNQKVDSAQHREGWSGSVTDVLGVIKGISHGTCLLQAVIGSCAVCCYCLQIGA